MGITIHIPTPLRQHTGGQDILEVQGSTVREALHCAGQQYPALQQRLFDGGTLRRFINVYVNDEDIRYLNDLDTPVQPGDRISIIPAVAGGARQ